jgi:hypothetical protein
MTILDSSTGAAARRADPWHATILDRPGQPRRQQRRPAGVGPAGLCLGTAQRVTSPGEEPVFAWCVRCAHRAADRPRPQPGARRSRRTRKVP